MRSSNNYDKIANNMSYMHNNACHNYLRAINLFNFVNTMLGKIKPIKSV